MRAALESPFFAVLRCSAIVQAQVQAPNEQLLITGESASTRQQGDGSVVEVEGNVTINLDRARLSADSAVIWLAGDAPQNHPQRRR